MMIITRKVADVQWEPSFYLDGKLSPTQYVTVFYHNYVDGKRALATNGENQSLKRHRYQVDLATLEMGHLTDPAVPEVERQNIHTEMTAAVSEYGIATRPDPEE
jgi:hypothetical protein